MKLIVGLGNPGEKYKDSRHNLGFMVADAVVLEAGLPWKQSLDWVCNFAKSEEVVYAKPSTFMNLSGTTVAEIASFYKIDSKDILVVYDEVDLPFGKIRLSFDGLSAGHKGIESIIKSLGGADFGRVRIGIGRPKEIKPQAEVAKHVLEDFSQAEKKELVGVISKAKEAINSYLADGIEATMNKFN